MMPVFFYLLLLFLLLLLLFVCLFVFSSSTFELTQYFLHKMGLECREYKF